jgi:hypothetical protein
MTCDLIPIDLTDEQKSTICGVFSVGCDWATAANFVGCSLSDIRRAMRADAHFAADIRRAEAGTELSHMRTVQQAAKDVKNWRASVWWLERHAPERFGARGGEITRAQLKAFTSILADVLTEDAQNSDDRQRLQARLKLLAESVDQLLRDEQPLDASHFNLIEERPHQLIEPDGLQDDVVNCDESYYDDNES